MPDVALITGASAGIGEVYARRLAERGHDLVLVARRADRLEALAATLRERCRVRALVVPVDLQAPTGPEEVFRRVQEAGLAVGLLVNNAGYGNWGRFAECELAKELGQIDLNLRALVALTRLFLPAMLARRSGIVVNVGSVAGFLPVPYFSTYAATKAFLLSFTHALAAEVAGDGVHVMVVCPGGTATEFQAVSGRDRSGRDDGQMTAEQVVDIALADLDRRRRVSVTGLRNKVMSFFADLAPRRLAARVTKSMFAPAASSPPGTP